MTEALKQIEFEVDGEKYRTNQLSAVEGRKVWLRVVKAAAPALGSFVPGETSKLASQVSMLDAAEKVLENLDEKLFDDLCDLFGQKTVHVVAEGKTPILDKGYFGLHFASRYVSLVKWLLECCKVNGFFDFLPGS